MIQSQQLVGALFPIRRRDDMTWLNISGCQVYSVFGQMAYCLGFHFLKNLFYKASPF